MDPKVQFFFYLASLVCFVLAALVQSGRAPASMARSGVTTIGLVPLGLALFVFPTVWTAGEVAF